MEEPPDPGGSKVPSASRYVTITSNNESGLETDDSMVSVVSIDRSSVSGHGRKRVRANKVCRHCNKRRRRRNSTFEPKESDCSCDLNAIHNIDETVTASPKQSNSTTMKQDDQSSISQQNDPKTNNQSSQSQNIGRVLYEATDVAPFIVHVQKVQASPDDNIILHPVVFGKYLKRQNCDDIVNGSVKKIGRNRVSLAFAHFTKANEFLSHSSLSENNFKAFIPTYNITRMGVVRGIPAEWSPEEVLENINVPFGCGKILKMRRLNYKTMIDGSPTWKPSQSVVLTFDGQVLPKRIYMCYNALPVELYKFPTVQCYLCSRFGHVKAQCRSKPRCYKCGQSHTAESCSIQEDKATCIHCSGHHFAINKHCPELERQIRIKKSMAESCISYAEANKLHPPVKKSFSDVTSSQPTQPLSNTQPQSPQSYRKTVTRRPHSPPQLVKGYDRVIHSELTKDYNMTNNENNGCAYKSNSNEQSLTDIIMTLINSLSKSTTINPDHVASIIVTLGKIIDLHNGCTSSNNIQL